jgi:hypothetical protein
VATNGAILKLRIRNPGENAGVPVATLATTILVPDAEVGSELPVRDPIRLHRVVVPAIDTTLL